LSETDELRAALRYRAAVRRALVIAETRRFGDAVSHYMDDRRAGRDLPPFRYQPDERLTSLAVAPVPRRLRRADLARPVPPRAMAGIMELAEDLSRQLTWSSRRAW
jgi:hypothetical protein